MVSQPHQKQILERTVSPVYAVQPCLISPYYQHLCVLRCNTYMKLVA